jgi:hypothetical protein
LVSLLFSSFVVPLFSWFPWSYSPLLCFIELDRVNIRIPAHLVAYTQSVGPCTTLTFNHCWQLIKSVGMLWQLVTVRHAAVEGYWTHMWMPLLFRLLLSFLCFWGGV